MYIYIYIYIYIYTKTKLDWVILGKRQSTNKIPNINAFLKEFDPENIALKFSLKQNRMVSQKSKKPKVLPPTEQHALNILDKTATNTSNPYVVELLRDDELPDKKNFTPSSFLL